MNTPVYYPPWFSSYEAYRIYINALVTRKEAEIRDGAKAKKGKK